MGPSLHWSDFSLLNEGVKHGEKLWQSVCIPRACSCSSQESIYPFLDLVWVGKGASGVEISFIYPTRRILAQSCEENPRMWLIIHYFTYILPFTEWKKGRKSLLCSLKFLSVGTLETPVHWSEQGLGTSLNGNVSKGEIHDQKTEQMPPFLPLIEHCGDSVIGWNSSLLTRKGLISRRRKQSDPWPGFVFSSYYLFLYLRLWIHEISTHQAFSHLRALVPCLSTSLECLDLNIVTLRIYYLLSCHLPYRLFLTLLKITPAYPKTHPLYFYFLPELVIMWYSQPSLSIIYLSIHHLTIIFLYLYKISHQNLNSTKAKTFSVSSLLYSCM